MIAVLCSVDIFLLSDIKKSSPYCSCHKLHHFSARWLLPIESLVRHCFQSYFSVHKYKEIVLITWIYSYCFILRWWVRSEFLLFTRYSFFYSILVGFDLGFNFERKPTEIYEYLQQILLIYHFGASIYFHIDFIHLMLRFILFSFAFFERKMYIRV